MTRFTVANRYITNRVKEDDDDDALMADTVISTCVNQQAVYIQV